MSTRNSLLNYISSKSILDTSIMKDQKTLPPSSLVTVGKVT